MSEVTSGLVEPVSKEMQAVIDRTRAAMAACFTDRPIAGDGYPTAFYEIATMLGIGAQAASPADVWRDQMRPKLEALTVHLAAGNTIDAVQWALDEIEGRTKYPGSDVASPEQQRQNCIDQLTAALAAMKTGDVQLQWPSALTAELRHILGMMCFQLGAPAHLFQEIGEFTAAEGITLGKRAEDEQAFMLHKLLGFWFEHGEDWGRHASADLTRAKAAAAGLEPAR